MPKFWFLLLLIVSPLAFADGFNMRSSNTLDADDYLFGTSGNYQDALFDNVAEVSLDVDIGIGSDCGQIDIKNTFQAALKNIFDEKYLQSMGTQLLAASPMLITCYMSPTWCAILKHARLRANFLANLRLDQCKAIDQFVDSRVEDFYKERSQCVRGSIASNSGNFEKAMDQCGNSTSLSLSDWSGSGEKTKNNSIVQSTAEWAGFTTEEAKEIVSLTKSFIGDDIIKSGSISVDYGPKKIQFTPRTYLKDIKKAKYGKLCKELLPKLMKEGGAKANVYRVVSEKDLKELGDKNSKPLIDRQTLLSLAFMPYHKRNLACRKLAEALAVGNFTEDMGKTLDFISSKIGTNPHLPNEKKVEADRKRRALKDQIELTLTIDNAEFTPLSRVLYMINKEGDKYKKQASKRELSSGLDHRSNQRVNAIFFDCADGFSCN